MTAIARYHKQAYLHAQVHVVCRTMHWTTDGHPTEEGVLQAIRIIDALDALAKPKEQRAPTMTGAPPHINWRPGPTIDPNHTIDLTPTTPIDLTPPTTTPPKETGGPILERSAHTHGSHEAA